jgi:hypothetical protein
MPARTRERVVEEAVEAIDALASAKSAIERGDLGSARDAVARAFDLTMNRAPSIPVSLAARLLVVSEPTIRKWLARGVLQQSPGKPVGVTLRSYQEVHQIVAELREAGKSPDVRELLLARIDDRLLAGEPWVRDGIAGLNQGTAKNYVYQPTD